LSRLPSSAQCARDSGCRKRPDLARTRPTQCSCARFQCCAGRRHVIDENEDAVGQRTAASTALARNDKRIPHIGAACGCRQIHLWRRVLGAPKCNEYRQPEPAREIVGLIEPALPQAPSMQRHGDNGICPGKDIGSTVSHHLRESSSDSSTAVVFQCVEDFPERALVLTDGACTNTGSE
jgi:hypothetical protein